MNTSSCRYAFYRPLPERHLPPGTQNRPRDSLLVQILAVNEPDMVMSIEGDKSPCPEGSLQPEITTAAAELASPQGVRDKRVSVAKPTFITPWYEKPVLVTCNVAGLVIIKPYEKTIRTRI